MSKSDSYVDTRQFVKDMNKLVNAVTQTADAVVHEVTQEKAFHMSFDDIEAIPYVENADGKIIVVAKSDTLDITVNKAAEESMAQLQLLVSQKMRSVLK